jgi:hypothetical protein
MAAKGPAEEPPHDSGFRRKAKVDTLRPVRLVEDPETKRMVGENVLTIKALLSGGRVLKSLTWKDFDLEAFLANLYLAEDFRDDDAGNRVAALTDYESRKFLIYLNPNKLGEKIENTKGVTLIAGQNVFYIYQMHAPP